MFQISTVWCWGNRWLWRGQTWTLGMYCAPTPQDIIIKSYSYIGIVIVVIVRSTRLKQRWGDHTLGQTWVTMLTNYSQLITPSLSLSAYWIIWSTYALEKCSPTLAATFSNSSGPKAPVLEMSNSSKTVWRVVYACESPPNPKIAKKAGKSISPTCPELVTTARICAACASRLSARIVLTNSSVETLPLPSQSNTSNTSLSLTTVSSVKFLLTYLAAQKPFTTFAIRYIQYNKTLLKHYYMADRTSLIDLSEYILRVYTQDYRYRLSLKPEQTYAQLLHLLAHKTGIPPQQLLVYSENGRRLNIRGEKKLKEVVYLRHGSILRVDVGAQQKRAASPQRNVYIRNNIGGIEKKSKCKHPSNMRCLSCLPPQKQNNQYAGNGLLTTTGKSPESKRRPCDHGANMKCLNCLGARDEKMAQKEDTKKEPVVIDTPQKKDEKKRSKLQLTVTKTTDNPESPQTCRHNPNIKCSKCINSPKNTLRSSKSQPLLNTQPSIPPAQKIPSPQQKKTCLHGESGKCLNCLPLKEQKASSPQKKKCNHNNNTKCIHCISTNPNKAAHIAFDQYLSSKSKNCINHPKQEQCPNCQPPSNLRLSLKKHCDQHQPYPKGLCNRCMPENVSLKSQEYRHVDYVQFMNNSQMQDFIRYWVQQKKMEQMRVAFIYGYYAEDPFYPQGIRAIVQAIYQPEQICTKTSFVIKDSQSKQEKVDLIVDSLALEKIGIIIASPIQEGYFSQEQIRIIADLQQGGSVHHRTGYKLSNFFTVLIKANKEPKLMEPQVFMVSDQGQALQASSMFIPNPTNPSKLKLKQSDSQVLPQVYQQGRAVTELDIEFLLVKIASGVSKTNAFAVLKNNQFPVHTRGGIKKTAYRDYLSRHFKKPPLVKYGDLNLLILFVDLLGPQTAVEVARRVGSGQQVQGGVNELIEGKMRSLM